MLYLFYGEDTRRSLNKLNELIGWLLEKKGNDSSLFEIGEENFDESYFKNLLASNHLFGEKNLVKIKRVFENQKLSDYFIKNLSELALSPNIFIFWEENPAKEILALFEKEAKKIWQFKSVSNKVKKIKEENAANKLLFQITDAFSQKKSRLSWLFLQKALMSGLDEKEIFWKIFWQLKNLIALKPHQNEPLRLVSEKIKMHPYVIQKCLKALPLFKKEELETLSKNLLDIYQDNRYNKIELNFGLEKIFLHL